MESSTAGVGLRAGDDRRHEERRGSARTVGERRRGDRRRHAAGAGLVLGALTFGGMMHQSRNAAATSSVAPLSIPRSEPVATVAPDHAFDPIITEASAQYGVDPELVRAVIRAESRFDPSAQSGAGAQGLMQLMPILSRDLGVRDPFDPRENIFGGVKYLGKLLDRHNGDVALALASYNAGPRTVDRYKGVPPFKETRGYVRKIQGMLADARSPRGPMVASADLRLGD